MAEETGIPAANDESTTFAPSDYFFIAAQPSMLKFLIDAASGCDARFQPATSVFVDNVLAVFGTAIASWILVKRAAHQAVFDFTVGIDIGQARQKEGSVAAEGKMRTIFENVQDRLTKTPAGQETVSRLGEKKAETYLAHYLEDEISREVCLHTLRQCTVLTWSAFEVLATDLFCLLANRDPRIAALLMKNDRTRKLYQQRDLVSALEEHGYDLSHTMGDILLSQCRLDDLDTIRTLYDVLFPRHESLRQALADDRLWRLNKTRNLIVHRAGIADQQFRKATGIDIPIGQHLTIHPKEFEANLVLVARVGVELLNAASTLLRDDPKSP
jgi:hypothetical protein